MGGRGALYAAYKMPHRFAAILSLAPMGPINAWADKLAMVPIWLFQGTKDQFTPLKDVEELVRAIEASGGHPQFTVLRDRDHYILDVYNRGIHKVARSTDEAARSLTYKLNSLHEH